MSLKLKQQEHATEKILKNYSVVLVNLACSPSKLVEFNRNHLFC